MPRFGTETTVHSWDELITELHSRDLVPVRGDEGGHRRSPYVFRGSDNEGWHLLTSLERLSGITPANGTTVERSLIRSFRKYAKAGTFDDKSEWYVMAVGQHNGLPTRCLDWTASPLVAAHFACGDESRKADDGVVWCLHAGTLRDINRRNHPSTQVLDGVAWVYDTRLLERQFPGLDQFDATYRPGRRKSRLLLMWEPPSLDDRIANQFGLLTMMNSPTGSQDAFLADHAKRVPGLVHRVVIAAVAKPEIRAMLDQNNISERTLFPGMPGLCDWLKRYYAKAW